MGTLRPFLNLYPLRKGEGSQCQVIKKKVGNVFLKSLISFWLNLKHSKM